MGRRDEPLPMPDWDHPIPFDPSTLTPEQIDVIGTLRALAGAIPLWVTAAVVSGAAPKDWQALADRFEHAARQCRDVADTADRTLTAAADRPVIDPARPNPARPDGR